MFKPKRSVGRKAVSLIVAINFIFSMVIPPQAAYAQGVPVSVLNLPAPGTMVTATPAFMPPTIKGVQINPNNPLELNFIVNTGETNLQGEELRDEANKLIKYFMASLTVPEDQMWVNLSPYEKDRIVSDSFGITEMGRDMLAQDYLLKQLTASLIYPEKELGKEFWKRVYEKANKMYGTTDIPVSTFNKIWIVPDKAVVYEYQNSAFVLEKHLKVMLEEDYLALSHQTSDVSDQTPLTTEDRRLMSEMSPLQFQILKEVVIPEIEREVNEGKTFANLRQIYNSMILATWFKQALKGSLLDQVYVDQNKVAGIDLEDKQVKQKIYEQYLEAFKVGVYDYIKEDYDPATQQIVPRKYFSGGMDNAMISKTLKTVTGEPNRLPAQYRGAFASNVAGAGRDFAVLVNTLEVGKGAVPAEVARARTPRAVVDPAMFTDLKGHVRFSIRNKKSEDVHFVLDYLLNQLRKYEIADGASSRKVLLLEESAINKLTPNRRRIISVIARAVANASQHYLEGNRLQVVKLHERLGIQLNAKFTQGSFFDKRALRDVAEVVMTVLETVIDEAMAGKMAKGQVEIIKVEELEEILQLPLRLPHEGVDNSFPGGLRGLAQRFEGSIEITNEGNATRVTVILPWKEISAASDGTAYPSDFDYSPPKYEKYEWPGQVAQEAVEALAKRFKSSDFGKDYTASTSLGVGTMNNADFVEISFTRMSDAAMMGKDSPAAVKLKIGEFITEADIIIRQFEPPTYFETRAGNVYEGLLNMLAALSKDVQGAANRPQWEAIRQTLANDAEKRKDYITALSKRNLVANSTFMYNERDQWADRLSAIFDDIGDQVDRRLTASDTAMMAISADMDFQAARAAFTSELERGSSSDNWGPALTLQRNLREYVIAHQDSPQLKEFVRNILADMFAMDRAFGVNSEGSRAHFVYETAHHLNPRITGINHQDTETILNYWWTEEGQEKTVGKDVRWSAQADTIVKDTIRGIKERGLAAADTAMLATAAGRNRALKAIGLMLKNVKPEKIKQVAISADSLDDFQPGYDALREDYQVVVWKMTKDERLDQAAERVIERIATLMGRKSGIVYGQSMQRLGIGIMFTDLENKTTASIETRIATLKKLAEGIEDELIIFQGQVITLNQQAAVRDAAKVIGKADRAMMTRKDEILDVVTDYLINLDFIDEDEEVSPKEDLDSLGLDDSDISDLEDELEVEFDLEQGALEGEFTVDTTVQEIIDAVTSYLRKGVIVRGELMTVPEFLSSQLGGQVSEYTDDKRLAEDLNLREEQIVNLMRSLDSMYFPQATLEHRVNELATIGQVRAYIRNHADPSRGGDAPVDAVMMTRKQILKELRPVLLQYLSKAVVGGNITENTSFDSLSHEQLIDIGQEIKTQFDIDVDGEDFVGLRSVRELIDLLIDGRWVKTEGLSLIQLGQALHSILDEFSSLTVKVQFNGKELPTTEGSSNWIDDAITQLREYLMGVEAKFRFEAKTDQNPMIVNFIPVGLFSSAEIVDGAMVVKINDRRFRILITDVRHYDQLTVPQVVFEAEKSSAPGADGQVTVAFMVGVNSSWQVSDGKTVQWDEAITWTDQYSSNINMADLLRAKIKDVRQAFEVRNIAYDANQYPAFISDNPANIRYHSNERFVLTAAREGKSLFDQAMAAKESSDIRRQSSVTGLTTDDSRLTTPVGGIDLNPALLDLQIKRDGNGVPLPLNQQPIQSMQIQGFVPIIINVTPINNLPLFLGMGDLPTPPSDQAQEDTQPLPALSMRKFTLQEELNETEIFKG